MYTPHHCQILLYGVIQMSEHEMVCFRMEPEDKQTLTEWCEVNDMTLSQLLRRMTKEKLSELQQGV